MCIRDSNCFLRSRQAVRNIVSLIFTCASATIASSVAAGAHTLPAVIVAEHRQLAAACKPVATSITTVAADESTAPAAQRTLPTAIDTAPAVVARGSQS